MRKFFLIIYMYIQSFARRKAWMILLGFGLLFTLFCYMLVYSKEFNLALQQTVYGQVVLTLTFMMMGIELIREQRREHLDDIIAAYSKNSGLIPWAQVLALGLIDLIVTLLIIAGCYIRMAMDGAPSLWIEQSLAYVALLYFLPCWILGVWGLLISQWNKGKSVYLPAMLVWIVTSSLFTYFTYYIDATDFGSGGFIFNALNMGMNNFHIPENISTGAPTELPRWIVRISVMALLTALFLCGNSRSLASTRRKKRRAWIRTASVIVCGVALVTFFSQTYSVFFTRFANPEDARNYAADKYYEYIPGQPVSLAGFPTDKNITLIKTDIDLSCTTQGISAEVTMEAAIDKDVTGQAFMLYSDLTVDEIQVDGEQADFERSNDGLMVRFPAAKKAGDKVAFAFCYHGYSLPIFPANETTVQLNRSFPWIPWPGIKTAVDNNDYSDSEAFFIEDWQRGDEVEYTLRYQGPGNLYTNLDGQGNDLYNGISDDGVSLYSGMLHSNYRDVDVYMPATIYKYAHYAVDALLDAYDPLLELCNRIGTIRKPEKPRSVAVIKIHCPLINGVVLLQEPYSRSDEWEIRLYSNDISSTISTRMHANSLEDYQKSTDVTAEMAVAYILNPCTGYPIDASRSSTSNFAAWLSVYLRAGGCDESDLENYRDMLIEECSGNGHEIINGISVPQTPLTEEEKSWISGILDRIKSGENFDELFKDLYHRLLQGEAVTASDIVTRLYNYHQGE